MNRREALRGVTEALLEKLVDLRELDAKYGDGARLAETGTKDHDRVMLAWEELEYRLQRIVNPATRRKATTSAPDPNQVALFE